MRVAIDETGDDGRSGRVDDLDAARIGRAVVGTDVLYAAVAHEDGDPVPKRRRATVGESAATKEDRRRRYLVFFPMVRMKVSIGMAESVSIWTVPRAPRPTETREIVSLSFASTMLTKSYRPSVAYCATTRAPMASISSLTFLIRRGFDCSVLTPAAVTFVRRTYVATVLPPAPYSNASICRRSRGLRPKPFCPKCARSSKTSSAARRHTTGVPRTRSRKRSTRFFSKSRTLAST